MKIEHVLFPSVFSKLRIRVSEGHFYCAHMIQFSKPTKIRSCERAYKVQNSPRLLCRKAKLLLFGAIWFLFDTIGHDMNETRETA